MNLPLTIRIVPSQAVWPLTRTSHVPATSPFCGMVRLPKGSSCGERRAAPGSIVHVGCNSAEAAEIGLSGLRDSRGETCALQRMTPFGR